MNKTVQTLVTLFGVILKWVTSWKPKPVHIYPFLHPFNAKKPSVGWVFDFSAESGVNEPNSRNPYIY